MATRKRTPSTALVTRDSAAAPEQHAAARALAREALEHIVRLSRRATLELVVEVGVYVLKTFYDGDLALARSHDPTKPLALEYLEKYAPEHDIAVSQIRIAVSMATQYESMPVHLRDRLSARQHRALLPIKDERTKVALARRAINEKLSGARITEIARRQGASSHTGRKALSDVERAVNAARRALVSAVLEAALAPDRVRQLSHEERTRIASHARTLRERIERITDAMEGLR